MTVHRRFLVEFVDVIPDAIFDTLTPDMKELHTRTNAVNGQVRRLKTFYYVVELHQMTLRSALTIFPVT